MKSLDCGQSRFSSDRALQRLPRWRLGRRVEGENQRGFGQRQVRPPPGALPTKPDAKHAQQVAFYADVLGCQASLIYASETGYRLFDESNYQELTREGIQRGVQELRARAWSRENVMRRAPDWRVLMQMHGPDWSDWGWRMGPSHLAEARGVWGLAA